MHGKRHCCTVADCWKLSTFVTLLMKLHNMGSYKVQPALHSELKWAILLTVAQFRVELPRKIQNSATTQFIRNLKGMHGIQECRNRKFCIHRITAIVLHNPICQIQSSQISNACLAFTLRINNGRAKLYKCSATVAQLAHYKPSRVLLWVVILAQFIFYGERNLRHFLEVRVQNNNPSILSLRSSEKTRC